MYTIKTRDTQQQQNPNIQFPNVVENNTNQTYKENMEDKFNVEQTMQKHRYFNFACDCRKLTMQEYGVYCALLRFLNDDLGYSFPPYKLIIS